MHKKLNSLLIGVLCLIVSFSSFSQRSLDQIQNYLKQEATQLELTSSDIKDLVIANEHSSEANGITFCYVQQQYQGRKVYNAISTFALTNEAIVLTGDRFQRNIEDRVVNTPVQISARQAILNAVTELGLDEPELLLLQIMLDNGTSQELQFTSNISSEFIMVDLVYYEKDGELIKAWNFSINELSQEHWWSIRVDATTGEIVDKVDWVVSCQFETPSEHAAHQANTSHSAEMFPAPPPSTDQYNVFAIPTESPNHGPRTLVVGPSDIVASPFGWHDDNGVSGAEYTITRGNNVFAYEDQGDNNSPGYSPDGTGTMNFDFPLDLLQLPSSNLDPAITNLFYMNNIMHDVWYQYGFDEASGNFQQNNYGNGGSASDVVNAEALDGGGTNNANFSTPPDGNNPRMQMYIWSAPGAPADNLTVNNPSVWAGSYTAIEADFGPGIPIIPITADLIIYEDATPDAYDACEAPINAAAMNGNIVIIRRGGCPDIDKVERAQNAGAIGVIVVDDAPQAPTAMSGTGATITVPAVMVNQYNGENLIAEIESGATLNVSIGNVGPPPLDGDFDNGIVAHEFGHGISTRLTGGAGSSNCLYNAEQMGEGWSDWFGLMLTIEPGDQAGDGRGIGTFASGEPITGGGIRPAPYSTNWSINNYTYGATNDVNGVSEPHGIGFVWCTMIWDLNWAMIDVYGFDSDVYNGTGGNNMTMHLVMTGLKLQPCGPGFVDARDAVIAADQLLYGGIHECLIWKVFAKRGLGYSADQGDSDDREDQTQAFDLPPGMDHSTTVVACETYTWPFNGMTYDTSGIYTVPISSTGIGCDTEETLNLTVGHAASINTGVNQVNEITLQVDQSGLEYQWLDCTDNYAPISGETSQSFVATQNGSYAVIVTENLCSDTSACRTINTIGLLENDFGNDFVVYPNPTEGVVTVDLGSTYGEVQVTVFDMSGRLITEQETIEASNFTVLIEGTTGMYLLEIMSSDGKSARIRIQKQ
ncbi:MAG: T9SS-dependent M36 family metallopeptidase [Crocinitomicaceae bacterium]|nr:T9SS-dependent M36 family metallopeptidase [Crocinitomicaceae bacterium]